MISGNTALHPKEKTVFSDRIVSAGVLPNIAAGHTAAERDIPICDAQSAADFIPAMLSVYISLFASDDTPKYCPGKSKYLYKWLSDISTG